MKQKNAPDPSHKPTEKKLLSTKVRKKVLIQALQASFGIVTIACKAAGMDRGHHYDWLRKDPEYKKAVEDIENITMDFVESKLHSRINLGDTTAIIFYAKTKGKSRGYIENPNIVNTNTLSNDIKIGYGTEDK